MISYRAGRRMVIAGVLVLLFTAWTYNLLPGLKVPKPNHASCEDDEGEYGFDILSHEWTCGDNWNWKIGDAGIEWV
jgi:hypothetical protein